MTNEKRYAVTIGLSVVHSDVQPFYDYGSRYGNLKYVDMVAVEAIVARHKAALDAALDPVIKDLVAAGVVQAGIVDPEGAAFLQKIISTEKNSR